MRKTLLLLLIFSLFSSAYIQAAVGDKYEAEDFIASEGAQAETNENLSGGGNVGYITNDTWIAFDNISFDGTEEWIEVSASGSTGGNIEFRLGASDGTLIGTAVINGTSGWSDYQTFTANITATTGTQVLYLVFTGGDGYLFNVDFFKLNANVPSYTLSTSASPAEGGTITTDLAGPEYSQGTDVELTAINNVGYVFDYWEDGNGDSLACENPMTIKINQDTSIVALFTTVETHILDTSIANGIITLSPDPGIIGDNAVYNTGTSVSVTASPTYGYMFSHWEDGSGDEISSDSSLTFTLSSDTSLNAIINEVTQYALPSWTFDNEYNATDTGSYTYYDPMYLPISNGISSEAWIFPNNPTMGSNVGLTASTTTLSTNDVSDHKVCRITWSGANEITDITDDTQHSQYFQFQFPTTGFEKIGVDFTFSGGQSDASDYLALAYSIDGGTTWMDGGNYHAEDHWNKWPNYTPELPGAEDQDLVTVRLIGVTQSTGGSNNFNLDEFNVTGFTSFKDNYIAYYKFDVETADTVIDEMSSNHGMVVGTMNAVEGYDSLALNFDVDTSCVMVQDNDAVDMDTNSFSISAIVKFDVSANSSVEKNILMKGGTGNDTIQAKGGVDQEWITGGKWYSLSFKGGELRFYVDDSTNKSQLGVNVVDYFPSDKWIHVAAVRDRDADSLKLFVNGQKVGSMLDITENSISTPDCPLIIGNNHLMNNAFNGSLDELTILDKALSDEEVFEIASKYSLNVFPLKWNVNLTSILVNGVEVQPFLGSIIKEYDVNLPLGTTDISVMAIAEDGDATIDYTTNADSSVIVVTAQDGVTTDTFKLFFHYVSTDASLYDLSVSEGLLSPSFSSDVVSYTLKLPASTTTVSVSATATSDAASISGTGDITLVADQVDTIKVTVTAQDEITTTVYTILVTESTETGIEDLLHGNTTTYFSNENLIISSDIEFQKAELVDISGCIVLSEENLSKYSVINVGGLKSSVYILILKDKDNNAKSVKLIK